MSRTSMVRLKRELALVDAVMIGLGSMVGAGLFVVTGMAARVAGPAFLLGLVIAGGAATCNALSSAQLAARYPTSGGTYEYGYEVLHPLAGFAAGWMFLASKLSAAGAVAIGFGQYVSAFAPFLPPRVVGLGAVVIMTAANYLGIKKTGRLNTVIVATTMGTLFVFVVGGLPSLRLDNFLPFAPHGARAVIQSAALLFFAYTGYARIATLAEEVREPRKTIPRAIIISVFLSLLTYLSVGIVAVGAVGTDVLGTAQSPLEEAAAAFPVAAVRPLIGIGAATAMVGVLLSQILGVSRVMLAMARRGDLPSALAAVHSQRSVPSRAVALTGATIAVLVVYGELEWIVSAATFTILFYYGITNVAALRLEREARLFPDWVPALGLVACSALATTLTQRAVVGALLLLCFGFAGRLLLRHLALQRGGR